MYRFVRLALAWIAMFALTLAGSQSAAAAPPTICTVDLTIFTTSPGRVTTRGQTTHFSDSGVAGQYTSGFLAGYTFAGAQDIVINNTTNMAQLHGSFTADGPDGTLTIRYNGHTDLNTGAATGTFRSAGGTGEFADFHWQGQIAAQLVSPQPPTFIATDSGPCHFAP